MSAIRSASSTTTWVTLPSWTTPILMRSSRRPGQATSELDAGVERLALRAVADAAVHGHDVEAAAAGERAQLGGDLLGELAGRGQHEGRRACAGWPWSCGR